MATFRRIIIAAIATTSLLALPASPALAADPTLCYGTRTGTECAAPDLTVSPAAVVTLPAHFEVTTDRSVTLVASIRSGLFISDPIVDGGRVLSAGNRLVAITCDPGACIVALPRVSGIAPGSDLIADARMFDPNGVTQQFFSGAITLASMSDGQIPQPTGDPSYFGTAWMVNPASNNEQRTFVRIVAPEVLTTVTLYAFDDSGDQRGPLFVTVPAGGAVQINPGDLENGNADKGIPVGVGRGTGKWRVTAEGPDPFRLFGFGVGISSLPSE